MSELRQIVENMDVETEPNLEEMVNFARMSYKIVEETALVYVNSADPKLGIVNNMVTYINQTTTHKIESGSWRCFSKGKYNDTFQADKNIYQLCMELKHSQYSVTLL